MVNFMLMNLHNSSSTRENCETKKFKDNQNDSGCKAQSLLLHQGLRALKLPGKGRGICLRTHIIQNLFNGMEVVFNFSSLGRGVVSAKR